VTYKIINADIKEWVKTYDGPRFHALLSDPPYALVSITKRFGKTKESDDTYTSDKVRRGADGYSRLIRGGFMGALWDNEVAFDSELWYDIGKLLLPGAYLLAFGGTRTFHRLACAIEDAGFEIRDTIAWIYGSGFPKSHNLHGVFEGYGSALKPAFEPIIVARKPVEGTVANNCVEYGSGALNIDGCRVEGEPVPINKLDKWSGFGEEIRPDYEQEMNNKGRWPANLITDGSEEVRSGFPQTKSGSLLKHHKRSGGTPPIGTFTIRDRTGEDEFIGDSGSAARFFYCAKVSKAERDAGCDILEAKKYGNTMHNANNMGEVSEGFERFEPTPARNSHPTLKPIALTEYLAKLILPPSAYAPRRLLVPFSGAGSEMIGAHRAGWEEITGVELSDEYAKIASARLEHWTNVPVQNKLFEE
jgi:site-specific DNA-methyltransferase (adenine-specific)